MPDANSCVALIVENFTEADEVNFSFLNWKTWISASILLNKPNLVIVLGESGQFPCCDFRQRQLEVEDVRFPRSPIKPAVEVAPFVSIFCTVKSSDLINSEKTARCTLSGYLDLRIDPSVVI